MVYLGIVKHGKIELPEKVCIPDGTVVRVEVTATDWRVRWEDLARRIGEDWQGTDSAVDVLLHSRR
ncbi:MAG: hypothetical protein AMXMBFR13_43270 [Phycisphaerae bacterium]